MEEYATSSTTNKIDEKLVEMNTFDKIVPKLAVQMKNVYFQYNKCNKVINGIHIGIPVGKSVSYN